DAERGFLGFKEVHAFNENTGIVTVNIHRQSWPFTGQVEESYQFVPQTTGTQARRTADILRDMHFSCTQELLNCQFESIGKPRESIMAESQQTLDAKATGEKISHTVNTLTKKTTAQGSMFVYV